jgi:outer membrane protein OmpA-like peptidoglycan-associated protein
MLKAFTARATAPRRMARHGALLLTCAGAALLIATGPASAQQYGTRSSVTVDYGVLDTLGGDPNLPALLGGGMPQQGSGAYGYPGVYSAAGQLLAPPTTAPRSTLTVPGSPAATGETAAAIKLIPPSEFKKKAVASAPAPQPAPAAAQPQPTQQAAIPPTPPPAPTPVGSAATPAAAEPAAAQPEPEPAPQKQATAEPAPPPPPAAPESQATAGNDSELAPGGALTGTEATTGPDASAETAAAPAPDGAEEVPPQPAAAPEQEAEREAGPETAAAPAEAPPADVAAADPAPAEAAQIDAPAAVEPTAEEAGDAPGETQLAALPASVEGQVSVTFAEGSSELSSEAAAALDKLAEELRQDASLRIQLLAYAQATDDNTSRARRTSLSRALEVRSYLIEKGVPSTRMDVRALGSNVEGEPADRVDIIPQAQ